MPVAADKNPPESKSYSERIVDFSGGLNTTISGSLLNSNEAQIARNLSLEQKGTIRPRRGRTHRYSTPFSETPVTGLGAYYKNDGTSRLLMSSGESIFSDAPHMSTKWTEKADWEQTGVTSLGYMSTTDTEGSITARKQPFGVAAKCEDATLWTALDAILSLNTGDSVYNDSDSIEVLIGTGKTSGYAYKTPGSFDATKCIVLTGYVKNVDATTGARLIGLTIQNAVSKSSAYVTSTAWTRITLKLSPTDLANIKSFGVQVTGTAAQRAYFTGLYYKYITLDEYNDANYAPPELTYYEVFQRKEMFDSQTDFNLGTNTHMAVVSDKLRLGIEYAAETFGYDTESEFSFGTYTDTSGTESGGSVVLARQV